MIKFKNTSSSDCFTLPSSSFRWLGGQLYSLFCLESGLGSAGHCPLEAVLLCVLEDEARTGESVKCAILLWKSIPILSMFRLCWYLEVGFIFLWSSLILKARQNKNRGIVRFGAEVSFLKKSDVEQWRCSVAVRAVWCSVLLTGNLWHSPAACKRSRTGAVIGLLQRHYSFV